MKMVEVWQNNANDDWVTIQFDVSRRPQPVNVVKKQYYELSFHSKIEQ